MTPPLVNVSDVVVEFGWLVEGKRVNEIPFPQGGTMLRAGVVLVVVAEGEAHEGVVGLCHRQDSV